MDTIRSNTTQVYTYRSAKKIYFAQMPSKCLLMEKKETKPSTRVLSLVSRNTVLISKRDGVLLFPKA